MKVHGWVILDNHLHAILAAPDLPRVMADFKRHTARRLIEQLEAEKCDWLLHLLRQWRAGHKVESELLQKLEYLHNWWRRLDGCRCLPGRASSAHEHDC